MNDQAAAQAGEQPSIKEQLVSGQVAAIVLKDDTCWHVRRVEHVNDTKGKVRFIPKDGTAQEIDLNEIGEVHLR